MENKTRIVYHAVQAFLKRDGLSKVIDILNTLHPADAADIVENLPDKFKQKIFEKWNPKKSAEAFTEIEDVERKELAKSLKISVISKILEEMSPDNTADLLDDLNIKIASKILDSINMKKAETIKKLLRHKKHTAGGLMTPEFIAVNDTITVREAIENVQKQAVEAETIYYVYVVNSEKKVVGTLSFKQLITTQPETPVSDVMTRGVIYVKTDTDQEEVARIIAKYDFIALPVMDEAQELVGVITIDDVVDVIKKETTEDMYRLSGTEVIPDIVSREKTSSVIRARTPWLLMALLGEVFLVGLIVQKFSYLILTLPALAVYWACMTSTGGNTAFQASTITVRAIALGEKRPTKILNRIIREAYIGIILGIITTAILFTIAIFWHNLFPLAYIIAAANIAIVFSGSLTGMIIPIVLHSLRIDPAVASSPLLALLMDAGSLLIYFSIATLVLHSIGILAS